MWPPCQCISRASGLLMLMPDLKDPLDSLLTNLRSISNFFCAESLIHNDQKLLLSDWDVATCHCGDGNKRKWDPDSGASHRSGSDTKLNVIVENHTSIVLKPAVKAHIPYSI
jgi:hypothetical protein